MTPIALTIAGSDCCAGAGIQTDLKTFSVHDVYGLTALTAVVSEVPGEVEMIEPVSDALLRSQVSILLNNYPVTAVKTGMLFSASKVRAIAPLLQDFAGPIVVDPVLVASSGDALASEDLIETMKAELFPLASLLTPNWDELKALSGEQDLLRGAQKLANQYGCWVLAKGGHTEDPANCIDTLVSPDEIYQFSVKRLHGISTHGTGCTLASAITARLAKGNSMPEACQLAQEWLHEAIKGSHQWPNGLRALKIK